MEPHNMMIVLTRTRCWSLSRAKWARSTPNYISQRLILILSSHLRLGLQSCLFPSGFPTKILRKVCVWINVIKLGSVSWLKQSGTQIEVADLILLFLLMQGPRFSTCLCLRVTLPEFRLRLSRSIRRGTVPGRPCLLGLRSRVYAEAVQVVQP